MTAKQLHEILADTCGAPAYLGDFLYHVEDALKTGKKLEYRFMGHLGFGGKLWINGRQAPYVTCYPEDESAGRKMLISLANKDLAELWALEQKPA